MDPYVAEVRAGQALATRIGYGSGEQVAEGDWEAARELPSPKPSRSMLLHPQQRLAALLSGRDVALACEELALRARLDLDQGREREAALQLAAGLDAALAELEGWRATEAVARRLDELHEHREAVAAPRGRRSRAASRRSTPRPSRPRWGGSRRRCARASRPLWALRESEPDSSTRAREGQGNQTFRAGNINAKKLVG